MSGNIKRGRLRALREYGVNMVALSILTGLFAGAVVTIYNILTAIGEERSAQLYQIIVENPAFIPLLFVGLAAGAFVIGTATRFVPMIRGSGVPQAEGAARGLLHFRWYTVMCSMFAASLACVFMGLRRLQVAAGASSGLAAAFNAPVTGLIFAMEEAFRSFSAQVFTCSAVSVAVSLTVRNLMRAAMGFPTGFTFTTFSFTALEPAGYLCTAIAALAAGLLGVAFYHLMLIARKGFKKITFLSGVGRYIIPFFVAGAFGLVTVYAMGGGHDFIQSLGSLSEEGTHSIFGISLAATLAVIVLFRFISTILAVGCGMPYGIFVPVLATGAGLGALLCVWFESMGLDAAMSDYIIIVTMAAYFTTVVRAPITGLVMVFEFTGQFENLLPALLGVGIGFIVGELFRTQSVFEKCLEFIVRERNLKTGAEKRSVTIEVEEGSYAEGRSIRSVLWPAGGMVTEVTARDGSRFVPGGSTMLNAGDKITFECVAVSEEELKNYLSEIVSAPR